MPTIERPRAASLEYLSETDQWLVMVAGQTEKAFADHAKAIAHLAKLTAPKTVKSRRPQGDGGLTYLKSKNLWRASVFAGYDADGKPVRLERTHRSKQEATILLQRLREQVAEDTVVLDRRTTVAELVPGFLETCKKKDRAPKTILAYRNTLDKWILPAIGARTVAGITEDVLLDLQMLPIRDGKGFATATKIRATASALLSYAVSKRVLRVNPMTGVHKPGAGRINEKKRGALTVDQAHAVLTHADVNFLLGLFTGARPGELAGLRWDYVDLEAGELRIWWNLTTAPFLHGCAGEPCGKSRAGSCPKRRLDIGDALDCEPLEGRFILVRPKAKKARVAPIPPFTLAVLKAHRLATAAQPNPHNLVFHRPTGWPRDPKDGAAAFEEMVTALGITSPEGKVTPYWLRHTMVTQLRADGVSHTVFGPIVGHVDEEVSDIYTHESPKEARAAVEYLEERILAKGTSDATPSSEEIQRT
ncbi:tyrosine-type recombinase/integrase [Diaminobutyricibacter sp. McL0618]|uniref:tyrosine-type recombinase/integrase n=1 Tax=Leifsonia sp. McL0618 TaxID=3415677 RepID=UPI003CECA4F2